MLDSTIPDMADPEKKDPGNSGLVMTQTKLHQIMDQKIIAAVEFASKASIYNPEVTAIELTTAQTILISLMHGLLNNDMGFCISLLELASTVDHLRSTYLPTWLRDDFNFLDYQILHIIKAISILTERGMMIPSYILKVFVSLAPKYNVAECCRASGNIDVVAFLESFNATSTPLGVSSPCFSSSSNCSKVWAKKYSAADTYESHTTSMSKSSDEFDGAPSMLIIKEAMSYKNERNHNMNGALNSVEIIEKPYQEVQEVWIEGPDEIPPLCTPPHSSSIYTLSTSTPSSTFAEDASAISPFVSKVQEYLNVPEDFKEEEILSMINYSDEEGNTPLHNAISENDTFLVESMLVLGAKVNARNSFGHSPIHKAASVGSIPMLQVLAQHRGDLSLARHDGCTPLHQAIINGQVFAAKWLLEHGCDINSRNIDGLTPLHLAAQWDQLEIVKFLLANGADIDVYSNNGKTPLDIASEEGNTSIKQLLSSRK